MLGAKTKACCKWCGMSFPDVRTLTSNNCQRNPNGCGYCMGCFTGEYPIAVSGSAQ